MKSNPFQSIQSIFMDLKQFTQFKKKILIHFNPFLFV